MSVVESYANVLVAMSVVESFADVLVTFDQVTLEPLGRELKINFESTTLPCTLPLRSRLLLSILMSFLFCPACINFQHSSIKILSKALSLGKRSGFKVQPLQKAYFMQPKE